MAVPVRRLLIVPIVLAVLAAAFFGASWWWRHRFLVDTDDAYVRATVSLVTPRIAGTVLEVPVDDNWRVKRNDLLVRLDPAEYRLQLDEADATLAKAVQDIEEARARVFTADSEVTLAQAELDMAARDDVRIEQLAKQKVVSTEEVDRIRTALRVARSRLEAARQEATRARAALGIPTGAAASTSPIVRRAQAARDEAALKLSYTELRAPRAGIVATKSVHVGQHVDPGQPVMRLVPIERAYVEANFKETQLSDVRIGQPATVVADMYPDYEYHGVVDSLAPGTGAAFALLPPENATGNWIKVVQRVPVKIRFTEPPPADRPLRVGLSVVATIDTRQHAGPLLTPLGQKERGSPEMPEEENATTKNTKVTKERTDDANRR